MRLTRLTETYVLQNSTLARPRYVSRPLLRVFRPQPREPTNRCKIILSTILRKVVSRSEFVLEITAPSLALGFGLALLIFGPLAHFFRLLLLQAASSAPQRPPASFEVMPALVDESWGDAPPPPPWAFSIVLLVVTVFAVPSLAK